MITISKMQKCTYITHRIQMLHFRCIPHPPPLRKLINYMHLLFDHKTTFKTSSQNQKTLLVIYLLNTEKKSKITEI